MGGIGMAIHMGHHIPIKCHVEGCQRICAAPFHGTFATPSPHVSLSEIWLPGHPVVFALFERGLDVAMFDRGSRNVDSAGFVPTDRSEQLPVDERWHGVGHGRWWRCQ